MKTTLDNGLTVILEPLHAAPVVAIQIWVGVGAADEGPEEAGLAHLHEHMLFKGTERRGPGEIARSIEARGGEINAWTSFDQTVYHVVLASSFFEEGLDILADAVQRPTFDAAELAREIEVVVEEIKRSEDLPGRQVSRALFETAYLRHPYRAPVLGSIASVRSFDRERMLAFFHKHYRAQNLTVVIVGDVDERAALAAVERQFGSAARCAARTPVPRPEEPEQREPRFSIRRGDVKESHLSLAFHIPSLTSPELAALDVLALILGQGESSRITLALEIERRLAADAHAYAYTPLDPGLLVVGATAPVETTTEALVAIVHELRRLALHPVPERELAMAKAMVEADAIYGRETVQGVARKLGFYQTGTGRLEFEAEYYARVAALTAGEIQEVARRYLRPENVSVAALTPRDGEEMEAALTAHIRDAFTATPPPRDTAPAEEPISAARLAVKRPPNLVSHANDIVSMTLPSGARVVVKRENGVPLFAVRAVYPGGLRFETEETNGISQLYSSLFTRATKRRSAEALAHRLDALAGSLDGSAGRNSVGLRGTFLSKHLGPGLELFAECLLEPSFDARSLEHERAELLQRIHARDDDPSGLVFDLFARTRFTRHPYRFDMLGETASVRALGVPQLEAMRRSALHPKNLTLCIVGDVDPDETFALAGRLFGGTGGDPGTAPEVLSEPDQTEPRLAFRALDKAQAHLVCGFPGLTVTDPDRFTLDVLSAVLSGQGGRLFLELRDRRSLAYSVSSFSIEGLDPGYFGVYLGTSPEKVGVGVAAIREELDRLLQGPVPEVELARAKRWLIGSHAIGLQKNGARCALMAFDAAYGLPVDSWLDFQRRVESVGPEAVLEVARRVLDPRRETLALVGHASCEAALDAARR